MIDEREPDEGSTEWWRDWKEFHRERRQSNLAAADPSGWTVHSAYHWSRDLAGHRLDYWPSRNKFRYRGRTMAGDVKGFIAAREPKNG